MAYGTVKVDNVTFTYNAADASTTFSGFYASTTNNLTLSGTASANTFTGTTANFTNVNAQNINVTTALSGLAITGGTAGFTTVTGTTVTGTTANFVTVSGTSITGGTAGFTTVTGTTVTGTTANFVTVSGTSITGGTAGFTTVTGTTVTGTTANFVTLSGTTVTGNIGQFTSLAGATTTMTSGVFASGTEPLPSISFVSDPNTGIYSPGADQLAVATNGTGRLFVDASGRFGIGATPTGAKLSSTTSDVGGTIGDTTQLAVVNANGAVGDFAGIRFNYYNDGNGGGKFAYIGSVLTSQASNGSADIVFGTRPTSTTTISERLRITSTGALNFVGAGTAGSTQAVSFNGSAPVDSLVITSGGNVGIGTSNINDRLEVNGVVRSAIVGANTVNTVQGAYRFNNPTYPNQFAAIYGYTTTSSVDQIELAFLTSGTSGVPTERMRLTQTGLGIGTTGPNAALDVRSATAWVGDGTTDAFLQFNQSATAANRWHIGAGTDNALLFYKGTYGTGSEKARIDSSGRLLVGTSSVTAVTDGNINPRFEVEGTDGSTGAIAIIRNSADANGAGLVIAKSRGAVAGSNTSVISADTIGEIRFEGADGTQKRIAASIGAAVDGTPGAADMPGRLVFSTTADGGSSPTERMRITSGGYVLVGKTSSDINVAGFQVYGATGQTDVTVSGSECMNVNRNTSDGDLIRFRQDNTVEGSISVSGTTVSYNGAHLSRWSQLPSGAERTEILRGSVLSNLDEMCEWGEEDNEQLNRMKVSTVEGDKNVSGVFQAWDDDDDTYTNDFYCAMTGDFIIRIAEGVTVERGDLLMSAGDGTAKPQDDDIIRSKTIAKVTSTNVSCTYDDGSYCVPCVLMAC